jgi:alcohol dehydrogenase class IV
MKWWREYLFENTDESARQIMHAANLAGQAICITQTTAAHAFSYKITSMYKLPHGHAVAICMAEIWEYMLAHPEKCIDRRGQDYLVGVYKEIAASMGSETPYAARDIFACMLKEMDIEKPVTANRDSDISILTSYVNPTRLNNNPVTLGESIIRDLYQEVVK